LNTVESVVIAGS